MIQYKSEFKIAHAKTSRLESGLVDNINDKGGLTIDGIAENYHKDWVGWVIVKGAIKTHGIKKAENVLNDNSDLQKMIESFYIDKGYWKSSYNNLPQLISNELYDTGVNMGASVPIKYLQRLINCFNKNEKLYKNISVDGGIGNKTVDAFYKFIKSRPSWIDEEKAIRVMFTLLNCLQGDKYVGIVENNEDQEVFFWGWVLNRLM